MVREEGRASLRSKRTAASISSLPGGMTHSTVVPGMDQHIVNTVRPAARCKVRLAVAYVIPGTNQSVFLWTQQDTAGLWSRLRWKYCASRGGSVAV